MEPLTASAGASRAMPDADSAEKVPRPRPIRVLATVAAVIGGYATWSATRDLSSAEIAGQYAAGVASLAWGLFGLATAWAIWSRPELVRIALVGWVIAAGAAAGLASRYWGDTTVLIAVVSFVSGAAIFAVLAAFVDRAVGQGRSADPAG